MGSAAGSTATSTGTSSTTSPFPSSSTISSEGSACSSSTSSSSSCTGEGANAPGPLTDFGVNDGAKSKSSSSSSKPFPMLWKASRPRLCLRECRERPPPRGGSTTERLCFGTGLEVGAATRESPSGGGLNIGDGAGASAISAPARASFPGLFFVGSRCAARSGASGDGANAGDRGRAVVDRVVPFTTGLGANGKGFDPARTAGTRCRFASTGEISPSGDTSSVVVGRVSGAMGESSPRSRRSSSAVSVSHAVAIVAERGDGAREKRSREPAGSRVLVCSRARGGERGNAVTKTKRFRESVMVAGARHAEG